MTVTDAAVSAEPRMSPRHTLFRLWEQALPAAVCDAAVAGVPADAYTAATVQTADGESVVSDYRKADSVFLEPAHWAGALVSHYAHLANLHWRLDLSGLGTLTLLRYEEAGHFGWHIDTLTTDEDAVYPELGTGLERKLSVTINLSDPETYEGGELDFLNGTGQQVSEPRIRTQGSVVVFPSTIGHRVRPVTGGLRYALVGWMVGPPLR